MPLSPAEQETLDTVANAMVQKMFQLEYMVSCLTVRVDQLEDLLDQYIAKVTVH